MAITAKKLACFWLAAVATATVWMGNVALTSKPAILEWAASTAYPASIILLAGSLALSAVRTPLLANNRGRVSLLKTGSVVVLVLAAAAMIHNGGGLAAQRLCFFVAISTVLAYVLLVVLRGDDRVW